MPRIGLLLLLAVPLACAAEPAKYAPVVRPPVPSVRGVAPTDVDRFIVAALESHQKGLSREADRRTLIRRVAFDLTGLPPTPAQIEAFLKDSSANAYDRMVEQFLTSPRYGERWGKFWLDAVGYADSNGYFNADSDRPLAWRYRDYVIRAFNADMPYDRFVREQIAGDELVGYTAGGDLTPAMLDAVTATHFLRNAPDGTGESDGNPDEVRTDRYTVLEGTVQNLMNGLLGITIQCARCHEHKFEPIAHDEYYALQAIFFPVYNPDRWSKPNDRVVTAGTKAEREAWQRRTELIDRQVKAAQSGLDTLSASLRDQVIEERLKDLPAAARDQVRKAVATADDKRTPEQKALLKTHAKAVAVSDDDLARRFPEFAGLRDQFRKTIAAREKERPAPQTKIAAFIETDPKPAVHHLLKRGQHNSPGKEVQPGVPISMTMGKNQFKIEPPKGGSSGRRTALAQWITSRENPLFARVMVNRIWQHHFGTGLVATPDNLGKSGSKPSHPELLDWLADEFVRSGWSVKAMHRLILTAAVYRQVSTPRPEMESIDPDNRLLARFPLRRLDAEAVRDAMLFVSGQLDERAGGPYVPTQRTKEGVVEVADKADGALRRAVYLQQRRTQVDTLLQLFDAPAMVSTCGKRSPSTVPLQSLALLNSEFARGRGRAFAARLAKESPGDRIGRAFELACGRPPEAGERAASERFLQKQRSAYAAKDADEKVWADLCQMILASNAFLYVE